MRIMMFEKQKGTQIPILPILWYFLKDPNSSNTNSIFLRNTLRRGRLQPGCCRAEVPAKRCRSGLAAVGGRARSYINPGVADAGVAGTGHRRPAGGARPAAAFVEPAMRPMPRRRGWRGRRLPAGSGLLHARPVLHAVDPDCCRRPCQPWAEPSICESPVLSRAAWTVGCSKLTAGQWLGSQQCDVQAYDGTVPVEGYHPYMLIDSALITPGLRPPLAPAALASRAACAHIVGYCTADEPGVAPLLCADSKILRFALPAEMPTLGMPLPSCLKVRQTFPNGTEPYTLDKSYS